MEDVHTEIITVFGYRQATINTGIRLPRELFQFVQDALPPDQRGNHQVIVARISNGTVTGKIAILFADESVIIGLPCDVQAR